MTAKKHGKLLAAALCLGVMMPVFMTTGCSKPDDGDEAKTLSDIWYDAEEVKLIDMSGVNGWGTQTGTIQGLVCTDGDTYLMDEGFYHGYNGDMTHFLKQYDSKGTLLMSVDIDEELKSPLGTEFFYPNFYMIGDDIYAICLDGYDFYGSRYDRDNDRFTDWERLTELNKVADAGDNLIGISTTQDGKVKLYLASFGSASCSIKLVTMDKDYNCSVTDMNELTKELRMSFVVGASSCGDGKCFINGFDIDSHRVFAIVDEDTLEYDIVPYDQTTLILLETVTACGDHLLMSDGYTISELNKDTLEIEEVMNFDCCNVNRYSASNCSPVYMDDSKIILFGGVMPSNSDRWMEVITLTKASENPNKDKTVLTVANLNHYGVFDYGTAEAIRIFNETDPDCYLIMDRNYKQADLQDPDDWTYYFSTEYRMRMNEAGAELSNRLMFDLMEGKGPDIILDGYSFSMLNSDQCLVDLTQYMDGSDGIDRSQYFTNVFEGNTYQITTGAMPMGIVYDPSLAGQTYGNLTYDEYREFVKDYCNGVDPISFENERLSYFILLFENICPVCMDADGKLHLDNSEFRALAEYCRDLPKVAGAINDISSDKTYFSDYGLYWSSFANGQELMALPSDSGLGYRMKISHSVGVSASCDDVDAAWRFVKILLSEDIQKKIEGGSISVNRNASRDALADGVAYQNKQADEYEPMYPGDEWGPKHFDEDVIGRYIDIMDNAQPAYNLDPDVRKVMFEEIQPYFAGDRTLDELIPVMEDRCNTIIAERG